MGGPETGLGADLIAWGGCLVEELPVGSRTLRALLALQPIFILIKIGGGSDDFLLLLRGL